MEILVGALVVLGFLAILARFVTRDASGEIRLPRVVDDSIGMWTLRRITGRRLGERAWDDDLDGELRLDPHASDPTRAALGASAAGATAIDTARPPLASTHARSVAVVSARMAPAYLDHRRRTRGRRAVPPSYSSATPVLDLRRRQAGIARPTGSEWRRRFMVLATVGAVILVAVVAVLGLISQSPRGQLLAIP